MLAAVIKKSFKKVIETPAISLFFVLFLILINLLASYTYSAQNKIVYIVLEFCMYALFCVFLSGWFQTVKTAYKKEAEDKANLYSAFLEGIGKNIVKGSLSVLIYFALFVFVIFCAQYVAAKYFGSINFVFQDLQNVSQTPQGLMEYFKGLTDEQKYILYGWELCSVVAIMTFNFIFMFYFPCVFDERSSKPILRPLSSIYKSIAFLFKNFFAALVLWLIIFVCYFVLMILNVAFAQNQILSLLCLLVFIYFVSFMVMLIFNYYESKQTPKLEQLENETKEEDNSSDGGNSLG